MQPAKNPSPDELVALIHSSDHKAAKWIEDLATGDKSYWPADGSFHHQIATAAGVEKYDKRIVTLGD